MKKRVLDMLLEYGNTQKEKEHMRGREVSYQFAPTDLTKCILTHTIIYICAGGPSWRSYRAMARSSQEKFCVSGAFGPLNIKIYAPIFFGDRG
jgi:hypothetical protein